MAKGILRVFGVLLIVIGVAVAAVMGTLSGGRTGDVSGVLTWLAIGGAFLVAGAPFLGFARVIELLEDIARQTRA